MVFFKTLPDKFKNAIIYLQMLQLKLKAPGPPCISSKSIMQRSKMISLDSAIFIEGKKRWQMEIGEKAKKMVAKKLILPSLWPYA
jgi:hypothetical protein